jgi:hypothetical protein
MCKQSLAVAITPGGLPLNRALRAGPLATGSASGPGSGRAGLQGAAPACRAPKAVAPEGRGSGRPPAAAVEAGAGRLGLGWGERAWRTEQRTEQRGVGVGAWVGVASWGRVGAADRRRGPRLQGCVGVGRGVGGRYRQECGLRKGRERERGKEGPSPRSPAGRRAARGADRTGRRWAGHLGRGPGGGSGERRAAAAGAYVDAWA